MRFGLLASTPAAWEMSERLDTLLAMSQAADELGFDAVLVPQHFADTKQRLLQPLPLLGRLTGVVDRARLGTGVMLAGLLNPYQVAEDLASLDVLSGGRALLGVGAGHQHAEISRFGVQRSERGTRLEHCLRIVRDLWSGNVSVADGSQDLLPISVQPQSPAGIPVWVAGTSDAGVRRAARVGDAWYVGPGTRTATAQRQLGVYQAELDRSGKPMPRQLPIRRDLYLATDRKQKSELPELLRQRDERQRASGYQNDLPGEDRELRDGRRDDSGRTVEMIGQELIAGDIDECRAQLAELESDLGLEPVVVFRIAYPARDPQELLATLNALGSIAL